MGAEERANEKEAAATLASLAAMLGWLNVPPRETLEREINALKARARSDNHHNALTCPYCNPDGKIGPLDDARAKAIRDALDAAQKVGGVVYVVRGPQTIRHMVSPCHPGATPFVSLVDVVEAILKAVA